MVSGTFEHKSFKRSYREDYIRDLEVPGMAYHIFYTFKLLCLNYKIFLPLLFVMVVLAIFLIGVADNFLNGQTVVFGSLVFLMIWLTTIFAIRHRLAGNKINFRDVLYNSMSPLLSTFVVLVVMAIQCIPIMIVVIGYSSAVETHFLDTPFYAFLFFTFAILFGLLSLYLVSGTLMAFVAVSAPGLYPIEALKTTNELMRGRKIRFILRIVLLLILITVMWIIVMFPIANLGTFMSQYEWAAKIPLVKVCGVIMSCFLAMYTACYFYVYYRWMLRFDTKKEENGERKSRKKN